MNAFKNILDRGVSPMEYAAFVALLLMAALPTVLLSNIVLMREVVAVAASR